MVGGIFELREHSRYSPIYFGSLSINFELLISIFTAIFHKGKVTEVQFQVLKLNSWYSVLCQFCFLFVGGIDI